MDSNLQRLFMMEIVHQCGFATLAYSGITYTLSNLRVKKSMDIFWYSLQSFLTASANISKIFWPVDKSPYKERGEFMRSLLDIDNNVSFRLRDPRNHLEHFDERLDDWYSQSTHHNIIDTSIGTESSISGDIDFMRFFNTHTFTFRFRGDQYEINPIHESLNVLLEKVNLELSKPPTF